MSAEDKLPGHDPLYYAEGDTVFKRPVQKRNVDGTFSHTLGFCICTMSENMGEGAAETVAALMNAGQDVLGDG